MTALATVHIAHAALEQRAKPLLAAWEQVVWHADDLGGFDPAHVSDDEADALGKASIAMCDAAKALERAIEGVRIKTAADYQIDVGLLDTVRQMVKRGVGGVIITQPGIYDGIAAEAYHGVEICDAPSISSSGLKTIIDRSPLHYWWNSPLNPNRPAEAQKRHFSIGKAAHDILLLAERWPERYHVLPETFNARATKEQAALHAERDAAIEAGLTILRHEDAAIAEAMATAIRANKFAAAALTNGLPEQTLCWKDAATGVWLRARPDFLPTRRQFIPDLKTAADASPDAFRRAMASHGYHQSAALYMDGIEAVFGERPAAFFFVVVEKEPPHCVALYQIPEDDIQRGRMLNRKAIDTFADCLAKGRWPGFADDVTPLPLPAWEQRQIDQRAEAGELSYAA